MRGLFHHTCRRQHFFSSFFSKFSPFPLSFTSSSLSITEPKTSPIETTSTSSTTTTTTNTIESDSNSFSLSDKETSSFSPFFPFFKDSRQGVNDRINDCTLLSPLSPSSSPASLRKVIVSSPADLLASLSDPTGDVPSSSSSPSSAALDKLLNRNLNRYGEGRGEIVGGVSLILFSFKKALLKSFPNSSITKAIIREENGIEIEKRGKDYDITSDHPGHHRDSMKVRWGWRLGIKVGVMCYVFVSGVFFVLQNGRKYLALYVSPSSNYIALNELIEQKLKKRRDLATAAATMAIYHILLFGTDENGGNRWDGNQYGSYDSMIYSRSGIEKGDGDGLDYKYLVHRNSYFKGDGENDNDINIINKTSVNSEDFTIEENCCSSAVCLLPPPSSSSSSSSSSLSQSRPPMMVAPPYLASEAAEIGQFVLQELIKVAPYYFTIEDIWAVLCDKALLMIGGPFIDTSYINRGSGFASKNNENKEYRGKSGISSSISSSSTDIVSCIINNNSANTGSSGNKVIRRNDRGNDQDGKINPVGDIGDDGIINTNDNNNSDRGSKIIDKNGGEASLASSKASFVSRSLSIESLTPKIISLSLPIPSIQEKNVNLIEGNGGINKFSESIGKEDKDNTVTFANKDVRYHYRSLEDVRDARSLRRHLVDKLNLTVDEAVVLVCAYRNLWYIKESIPRNKDSNNTRNIAKSSNESNSDVISSTNSEGGGGDGGNSHKATINPSTFSNEYFKTLVKYQWFPVYEKGDTEKDDLGKNSLKNLKEGYDKNKVKFPLYYRCREDLKAPELTRYIKRYNMACTVNNASSDAFSSSTKEQGRDIGVIRGTKNELSVEREDKLSKVHNRVKIEDNNTVKGIITGNSDNKDDNTDGKDAIYPDRTTIKDNNDPSLSLSSSPLLPSQSVCDVAVMQGIDLSLLDDAQAQGWVRKYADNEVKWYKTVASLLEAKQKTRRAQCIGGDILPKVMVTGHGQ